MSSPGNTRPSAHSLARKHPESDSILNVKFSNDSVESLATESVFRKGTELCHAAKLTHEQTFAIILTTLAESVDSLIL